MKTADDEELVYHIYLAVSFLVSSLKKNRQNVEEALSIRAPWPAPAPVVGCILVNISVATKNKMETNPRINGTQQKMQKQFQACQVTLSKGAKHSD